MKNIYLVKIENQIDMRSETMNNMEIAMRVSSSVASEDTFYTDLNGFQVPKYYFQLIPTQCIFLCYESIKME